MNRLLGLATMTAVLVVVAAGCSSSNNTNNGTTASTAPATSSGAVKGVTVTVRSSKLGKILVDNAGRTLYLFEKDKAGRSSCAGRCAAAWPPYITKGTPQAGSGALAAELGTTSRDDGKTQVTYHGHPVYRYLGDAKAGDTAGQGLDQFGAEWFVLSPSGNEIKTEGKE